MPRNNHTAWRLESLVDRTKNQQRNERLSFHTRKVRVLRSQEQTGLHASGGGRLVPAGRAGGGYWVSPGGEERSSPSCKVSYHLTQCVASACTKLVAGTG